MKTRRAYPAIDYFRIIAALLVIAVHTAPLVGFGALPDYLFSHVIARLAVPFFLAASGFFLFPRYLADKRASFRPVARFIAKTALVYGIAILIYLPVNLYAGHFAAIHSLGDLLKMLVMDGTMYHLWYLPAAMLGVLLVWLLLRFLPLGAATLAAGMLYLIGLFGDSYYGLISAFPSLHRFYQGIFSFSSYTRNGIFLAPIFLLAGLWAAKYQTLPRRTAATGLILSFLCLLGEGLLLYPGALQRHDSMYIALPLCVFFLLAWLSSFKGAAVKQWRDITLLVYILHPAIIILLRGAAKPIGLEALIVQNNLIHFFAVSILSFAAAAVLVFAKDYLLKAHAAKTPCRRASLVIDLDALAQNTQVVKGLLPATCQLMPAIKADAYGFGAVPVARALWQAGVRHFCVASLSEGIELRRHGVGGCILILGHTHPDDYRLLKRYRLAQTVVDYRHAVQLAEKGVRLPVHIKVDCGMHRLGERSEETAVFPRYFSLPHLQIEGIYTQLSHPDSTDEAAITCVKTQIAHFNAVLDSLSSQGIKLPKTHLQSSYGIINYPHVKADFARPGLAIYGIIDKNNCIGNPPALRPVFTLKATIALTKQVYKGEHVGYGDAFSAPGDMQIAAITLGYADGLPRSLSNGAGGVLVNGEYAPFVGTICMDRAMIDTTHIPAVKAGDTVTVIGKDGWREIDIHRFAAAAGTIPNEIVSRFGKRLTREYVK